MDMRSLPEASSAQVGQPLYHRCCSTDAGTLNAAFQELGLVLLRIACARLRDQPYLSHVAEDCAQQALVTIWRKLHAGQGPERPEWFTTWCASIVIHRVLDEQRRTFRSRIDSLDELVEEDESKLPPASSNPAADERSFATADDGQRFIALIENHPRLSNETKLVLLHGYLLERDDQELAEQLGKSRATMRVLRFRGLKVLREDQEFMAQVMSLTHAETAPSETLTGVQSSFSSGQSLRKL